MPGRGSLYTGTLARTQTRSSTSTWVGIRSACRSPGTVGAALELGHTECSTCRSDCSCSAYERCLCRRCAELPQWTLPFKLTWKHASRCFRLTRHTLVARTVFHRPDREPGGPSTGSVPELVRSSSSVERIVSRNFPMPLTVPPFVCSPALPTPLLTPTPPPVVESG